MVKQFLGRNGIRNDRTLPNSSFDIVGSESVHFTIFTTTGRVPRGILSPFMGKLAISDQTAKERNALSNKEFPKSIEKKTAQKFEPTKCIWLWTSNHKFFP